MRKSILSLFLVMLITGITSCKKEEGKGGKLTIKGKVYALFYDDDLNHKTSEGYLADHDVYIVYGDQSGYGDKVTTGIDGSFEFTFLRKGKYTIYSYSKDTTKTNPEGHVASSIEVTLDKKDVELTDLVVVEEERRLYRIKGRIKAEYYSLDRLTKNSESYISDQDVFAVNMSNPFYSIRERTTFDGRYEFRDLPAGNYRVYTTFEDGYGQISIPNNQKSEVNNTTTISASDIMMPDLTIRLEDETRYSIRGYVYMNDYDNGNSYFIPDYDVYITYGADTSGYYGDRVRTYSPGGQKPFFEFMVSNGTYIVTTVSKDPFGNSKDITVSDTVVVSGANVVMPDSLVVYDY